MKVKVNIESTDESGEVIRTSTAAVLEERDNDYKITYVEALSDSGEKTKTTMYVTSTSVRIIRDGEIKSDFIYSEGLTHNSMYKTMYGEFPVSVVTRSFNFIGSKMTVGEDIFFNYVGVTTGRENAPSMKIDISYELFTEGAEPLAMRVSIRIE